MILYEVGKRKKISRNLMFIPAIAALGAGLYGAYKMLDDIGYNGATIVKRNYDGSVTITSPDLGYETTIKPDGSKIQRQLTPEELYQYYYGK